MAASSPTASTRPPRRATAWARGGALAIVRTVPLTRMTSASGTGGDGGNGEDGREPTRRSIVSAMAAYISRRDRRQLRERLGEWLLRAHAGVLNGIGRGSGWRPSASRWTSTPPRAAASRPRPGRRVAPATWDTLARLDGTRRRYGATVSPPQVSGATSARVSENVHWWTKGSSAV